jgi:hypothetical protein
MRRMTLAVCLVCTIVAVSGAGTAAADPVNNPHATVFTVTCEGVPEFQVVGTGAAGHVLGSNRIAVLLAGTRTEFVNGVQTNQFTFDHPGRGVSTLACTGFSEFTVGSDTIRIEITDARIHLTPARS